MPLHELVEESAPSGPRSDLSTVSVDLVPVMLTETGVKVDLIDGEPLRLLPEVTDDPEEEDDRNGEAGHEEVLGVTIAWLVGRADGDEELHAKNSKAKGETQPRAVNATSSLEGNQVEASTLSLPGGAEADMSLQDQVSKTDQKGDSTFKLT